MSGVRELVEDMKTSILIEPNNMEALVTAVKMLLEDRDLAERLVENAYGFVTENLTWDTCLEKYMNFYQKLWGEIRAPLKPPLMPPQ